VDAKSGCDVSLCLCQWRDVTLRTGAGLAAAGTLIIIFLFFFFINLPIQSYVCVKFVLRRRNMRAAEGARVMKENSTP
jgi:hypothetical protein